MWHHQGPNYREWLELIKNNAELDFDGLKAMAERIEREGGRLSQGQRADLLSRLGTMQVRAAKHGRHFRHAAPVTGPSAS